MQTLLVIITFLLAVGYLSYTFIFASILKKKKKPTGTLDGGKTKCGDANCGCH